MAKILLVEDDELTAKQTSQWLAKTDGHTVETVVDGCEALDRLKLYDYDLVILDWNVPGLSGIQVCEQFRAAGGRLPILILTGRTEIGDKVIGFNVGADDYLTKPFDLREMSVRVRALMRRPADIKSDVLEVASIRLDQTCKQVFKAGAKVHLTPREYALLELLMRNKNRPFTAEQIVNQAWSTDSDVSPLTVKTVISRIRAKLDEGHDSVIQNAPGMGYCVKDDVAS